MAEQPQLPREDREFLQDSPDKVRVALGPRARSIAVAGPPPPPPPPPAQHVACKAPGWLATALCHPLGDAKLPSISTVEKHVWHVLLSC